MYTPIKKTPNITNQPAFNGDTGGAQMRSSFFTGETSSYGALGLRDRHSSGRHWRLGRTEQDIESWSGYMVKHVDMLNI